MQSNSIMKAVLAVVLCVSLAATGCTAQWISVALAGTSEFVVMLFLYSVANWSWSPCSLLR